MKVVIIRWSPIVGGPGFCLLGTTVLDNPYEAKGLQLLEQGGYTLRCIGHNEADEPVSCRRADLTVLMKVSRDVYDLSAVLDRQSMAPIEPGRGQCSTIVVIMHSSFSLSVFYFV